MSRIIIYPTDLVVLEGISLRVAQQKVATAKKNYKIGREGLLSIRQYCQYNKLDYEAYKEAIK